MKAIRLFTLILPLFLALCAGTQVSASTPSGSISSANTSITTRDKNGNLQSRVDYAAYYIAAAHAYGMNCNWWFLK